MTTILEKINKYFRSKRLEEPTILVELTFNRRCQTCKYAHPLIRKEGRSIIGKCEANSKKFIWLRIIGMCPKYRMSTMVTQTLFWDKDVTHISRRL